ncbi:MAG: hypothetical protein Q8L48_24380 [Archangium sp.]|nr:hypothetical protein [Archangium sp.]
MHWAGEGQKGTISDALVHVIEQLKQEILATPAGPPPPPKAKPRFPWDFG